MAPINDVALYTKVTADCLINIANNLVRLSREGIAGDFVECGVWRGGVIALARKINPSRRCWLYDTFDGMTEPTQEDGESAIKSYHGKKSEGRKWARATADEVRDNLRALGVYNKSLLHFVPGPVEQTLLDPENLPDRIAFLHLDTDWYASTKVELEVLWPRVVPGGLIMIDDYGHWQGARKAVDEYFGPNAPLIKVDYTAVVIAKEAECWS